MKTFLKYDITIDKFLGDGVLAFSNDPIPRPDFILRVAEAAVEVRARIASRNYHYKTYWLNDFQIRVGIASGPASVGFYGSDNYTKTYTALGAVVNLASRLCSTADPNQIVVSSEVAAAISGSFVVERLDKRALKGFDTDSIEIYGVLDDRRLSSKDAGIDVCPMGHGVLVIETTLEGIYVFICRTCGYVAEKDADLYSETMRVTQSIEPPAFSIGRRGSSQ